MTTVQAPRHQGSPFTEIQLPEKTRVGYSDSDLPEGAVTCEDDREEDLMDSQESTMAWRYPNIYLYLLALILIFCCLTYKRDNDILLESMRGPVKTPDDQMGDLVQLVFRTNYGLHRLNVTTFLCYSTLWGAVSIGAILPWDRTISLCALDESISLVDEAYLHTALRRLGVDSTYNLRHGFYRLHYGKADGALTIFRKTEGTRIKSGIGTRILLSLGLNVESFPNRIVEDPFVDISFYGHNFSVPRESVSIIREVPVSKLWEMTKGQNLRNGLH